MKTQVGNIGTHLEVYEVDCQASQLPDSSISGFTQSCCMLQRDAVLISMIIVVLIWMGASP